MAKCSYEDCGEETDLLVEVEDGVVPACDEHREEVQQGGGDGQSAPDQKYQSGSVHLSVWENEDSLNTFSFQRFYTEDDGETFEATQNFRGRDLPHITNLIRKVMMEGIQEE